MVDLGCELDLGRLEGVVGREVEVPVVKRVQSVTRTKIPRAIGHALDPPVKLRSPPRAHSDTPTLLRAAFFREGKLTGRRHRLRKDCHPDP